MPDHDPANRRRGNQLDSLFRKLPRDRFAKRRRLFRELKHPRTLEIDRAMQPARKLEMTFEQRSGLFEFINHVFSVQILTSVTGGVLQSGPHVALSQSGF